MALNKSCLAADGQIPSPVDADPKGASRRGFEWRWENGTEVVAWARAVDEPRHPKWGMIEFGRCFNAKKAKTKAP